MVEVNDQRQRGPGFGCKRVEIPRQCNLYHDKRELLNSLSNESPEKIFLSDFVR